MDSKVEVILNKNSYFVAELAEIFVVKAWLASVFDSFPG